MGNQNAHQGVSKKPTYAELENENELLREQLNAALEILGEVRALVDL